VMNASGGQASGGASGGAATGGASSGGAGTGGDGSGGLGSGGTGGVDPNFHLFLLIGQSNMAGAPTPDASDKVENPNIQVLGYQNCQNLGRTYNEWDVASPPLHDCYGGLGPGDNFAKTVAAEYPEAKIGLIPCAIPGVDIDFFRKGVVSSRRNEFQIPPDNHWDGAYDWVMERAQLAQQEGVIRGILFHQGESNPGQSDWPGKVKEIVEDLRTDLSLGEVPFLVGELLHSCSCGSTHNPLIAQLPGMISETYVISASGLAGQDQYHFNLAGQRTLGQRYAEAFLAVFNP